MYAYIYSDIYVYVHKYVCISMGLGSLFNGISTFVGYLMPKPFP